MTLFVKINHTFIPGNGIRFTKYDFFEISQFSQFFGIFYVAMFTLISPHHFLHPRVGGRTVINFLVMNRGIVWTQCFNNP